MDFQVGPTTPCWICLSSNTRPFQTTFYNLALLRGWHHRSGILAQLGLVCMYMTDLTESLEISLRGLYRLAVRGAHSSSAAQCRSTRRTRRLMKSDTYMPLLPTLTATGQDSGIPGPDAPLEGVSVLP